MHLFASKTKHGASWENKKEQEGIVRGRGGQYYIDATSHSLFHSCLPTCHSFYFPPKNGDHFLLPLHFGHLRPGIHHCCWLPLLLLRACDMFFSVFFKVTGGSLAAAYPVIYWHLCYHFFADVLQRCECQC
jgi:hypothetical protein